jgi:repressor LexA
MVNAKIIDGNMIIVNVDSSADSSDIVVALIDDSATVKCFFKEDGHYHLQPENDTMEPIIVDHIEILGKLIGVFRAGIR